MQEGQQCAYALKAAFGHRSRTHGTVGYEFNVMNQRNASNRVALNRTMNRTRLCFHQLAKMQRHRLAEGEPHVVSGQDDSVGGVSADFIKYNYNEQPEKQYMGEHQIATSAVCVQSKWEHTHYCLERKTAQPLWQGLRMSPMTCMYPFCMIYHYQIFTHMK